MKIGTLNLSKTAILLLSSLCISCGEQKANFTSEATGLSSLKYPVSDQPTTRKVVDKASWNGCIVMLAHGWYDAEAPGAPIRFIEISVRESTGSSQRVLWGGAYRVDDLPDDVIGRGLNEILRDSEPNGFTIFFSEDQTVRVEWRLD